MSKWWNRIHNFIIDQERLDSELNWIKWIVLLLLPLFDNFEGFGIRFTRHAQKVSRASKEIADELLNNPNKDIEELKKELENISKNIEQ